MTKDYFSSMITNVILPLFSGAQIVGEEESNEREYEVAQGSNGTMLLKPSKNENYRLVVKRNQPFKNNDIMLVKSIMTELINIELYEIKEHSYVSRLQNMAIEKSICESLSASCSQTLLDLISNISKWSERTYEGQNLTFGFVINENVAKQEKDRKLHFSNLLDYDFSALLSDGKRSTLELDKNGYLLGHINFEKQKQIYTICPQEFENLAKYCNEAKIGIALQENGDMTLFKNHSLLFAKRRGKWNCYDHENLIDLLSSKVQHTAKEIRRALYMSCLDVSFNRAGGCIVYLNKDNAKEVLNHIDINDIITEKHFELKKLIDKQEKEKLYSILTDVKNLLDCENLKYDEYIHKYNCVKSIALNTIIAGRKFQQLSRKLREELIAMDGATIIDEDGTIIAAGAIVKIEAGSIGGGRLAATKTLAKYGVAVKISTDGIIETFTYDKKNHIAKPIFTIG